MMWKLNEVISQHDTVCDLKENGVLEVNGTGDCGRESQDIGFAEGGVSRCDAADRDEVTGWGNSLRIS